MELKNNQNDMEEGVKKLLTALQPTYSGRDRKITPHNVYQPAITNGRDILETFVETFLLPGSRILGLHHLDDCLKQLDQGKRILFLAEHRGNLDVPSFYVLLNRAGKHYAPLLERLVYIAGRKLNESSDFIKIFTEKYSRLVIVPRRDSPPPEAPEYEAFGKEAASINRAAFRQLITLRDAGKIFVLFPLGGRIKPGHSTKNAVPETVSYTRFFDAFYPLSMEGNILPPAATMEHERPVPAKVCFRVGPRIDSKPFLAEQKALFADKNNAEEQQLIANHILQLLASLRTEPPTP